MHRQAVDGDRYLLLLGADMPLRERAVVAALRVFDGPVAATSAQRPVRGARHFDHVLAGDCLDAASTLHAVREFEQHTGMTPAAAVPFVDPSLMSAHAVAEHYGLPCLALDGIRHSSVNKDLMKERLALHGIPTPRHLPFEDLASLEAAIAELGLPCVLKPSGFGGSMGVVLVRDASEVEEACGYAIRTFEENYERFSIKNHGLQAEPYCDLPHEVSLEVLCHGDRREVLAVVDKDLAPPPFFAEMGHRVPSAYSDLHPLRDMAVSACAALGLDRGLAHVEIRHDGGGEMQVIEVGARTGGDGILDLVERVYGIAPYEWHIRSYLSAAGELGAWPVPAPAGGVAAIAMLKAPPGRIAEVRRPRSSPPEPLLRYELFASAGDVSGRAECYEQREGYLEAFWPGRRPEDVPRSAHLALAEALVDELFVVTEERQERALA
jgi:biotin carboxylase